MFLGHIHNLYVTEIFNFDWKIGTTQTTILLFCMYSNSQDMQLCSNRLYQTVANTVVTMVVYRKPRCMKGFNRIDNQQTKDSKGCHLTINPNHAAMATSVSRATNQSEMKLQEGTPTPNGGAISMCKPQCLHMLG